MRVGGLVVVLTAACSAGPAGAAELTASPPLAAGVDRGIASLRCATEIENVSALSRGALLAVGASASAEVILTTAHGLPPEVEAVKRDCRVLVRGKEYRIADVWHAGGDRAGPEHDWAVVVTQRISGDVHRWRVAQVAAEWLVEATARGAPVTLVLRSADATESDCRLEAATSDPRVLLAHSCTSHPGLSGSPVVVGLAGESEPVLIALHIGSQMRWVGTKLDFVRIARPLDAELAAAIEQAARRTAVAPPAERRGRR